MNGTSSKLKAGGKGKIGIHKICSCSCNSPPNGFVCLYNYALQPSGLLCDLG